MSLFSAAKPPAGVRIAGTGAAIPPRRVTNADLEKIVDTSDEWITQRTGIRARHLVDDQRCSDLAAEAVTEAMNNAAIQPNELDLLIAATMTPDVVCPALSATTVAKVGAIPAGAFDINIACTGFVAALNMASAMVQTGHYRNVAVVAAETLSRIVDWQDRGTCVLFGDAAAAAILQPSDNPEQGCRYQMLGSDGDRGQVLYVPRDESDIPAGEENNFSGKFNTLQMNGKVVYKFAVETLANCVAESLEAVGLTADDVKMVIPHQSNIRMLKSAWKRLGFDEAKICINIDRFGNTSAASVGICLHELMQAGMIDEGDNLVFVAQGGGLSWGTNLWKL